MAQVKIQGNVEYRKSITVDDPDAYAEVTLRLEGLMDEGTEELHKIFSKFYEEIETVVRKEMSGSKENQTQKKTVLTCKNGRPVYEDIEV